METSRSVKLMTLTLVDCSIGGLGRSAGNTRTELMIPVIKLMGYEPAYDLLAVFKIWDQTIRPILKARRTGPVEIAGGYALVHSGLMEPIRKIAEEYEVSLEALLLALGDNTRIRNGQGNLESLAQNLVQVPNAQSNEVTDSDSGLLKVNHGAERTTIINTLKGVIQTLESARALSSKTGLPLVLWTVIESYPPEEAFMAAEFIDYDENHIIVRGVFSSVSIFADVMRMHGDKVDIYAFDSPSSKTVDKLHKKRADWAIAKETLYFDSVVARQHLLFSAVYQLAVEYGVQHIVFSGPNIAKLSEAVPRHLRGFDLYAIVPIPSREYS